MSYNMDESEKQYAKMPVIKDHGLYEPIYMNCSEKAGLQRQKVNKWLLRTDDGNRVTANGYGVSLWRD